MTDHQLQDWLEVANDAAIPLGQLIEADQAARESGDAMDSPLDDTFGWGARFDRMKKNSRSLEFPRGLLLTGPSGCGRHTAAAHMFRVLVDTHCLLPVNGRELCADGYAAATQRLRYALDNPTDGYPWLLLLEEMEECECRRELLTWLGQVMDATRFQSDWSTSLFVILIDSREEDIPSVLRRHLRLCRMSLPTARQRSAYFKKKQFPMICHANSLNFELLVNSTEGITYAQLADLAQNLECLLYTIGDRGTLPDEELLDFLTQQMPDPFQEDPLQSLAHSARQFLEHLPELITRVGVMPAGVVQTVAPAAEQKPARTEVIPQKQQSKEEMRREIAEAPVSGVQDSLFGANRVAQLEAKYKTRQRS